METALYDIYSLIPFPDTSQLVKKNRARVRFMK